MSKPYLLRGAEPPLYPCLDAASTLILYSHFLPYTLVVVLCIGYSRCPAKYLISGCKNWQSEKVRKKKCEFLSLATQNEMWAHIDGSSIYVCP